MTSQPLLIGTAPASMPGAASRWLRRALGMPLVGKLVGANALVVVAAAIAILTAPHSSADARALVVLAAALLIAVFANAVLVVVALRPVRDIERVAADVGTGNLTARVVPSAVADADTARLGRTFNLLLDNLARDRARLRALASRTIRAQDEERSRIARELHDSAAQSIAALSYQLAAAARDTNDVELAPRLEDMRALAGAVLEEVRTLAHVVHPRVLEDLGLAPALEWLGRTLCGHLDVTVHAQPDAADGVPNEVTAALYRVAQESLRNAERHADARHVTVSLRRERHTLLLDIIDDGRGFSLPDAEARRPGMGLFAMRERIALVDGDFEIETAPGRGTHLIARVPLHTALST